MKKNIDIDLYKDGFDAKIVNCIHNPIAAAAGVFERNNYFYYCFMYCMSKYFVYSERNFTSDVNELLELLNLGFVDIEYKADRITDLICKIKEEIRSDHPVLIICKYNTLFFSSYYKNDNFGLTHGFLVSGYNDENETFTINDASLLRNLFSKEENSDIYFPLQIKVQTLIDIIVKSNEQFLTSEYNRNNYYNKVFSIIKKENSTVSYKEVIDSFIGKIDTSECELIKQIREYDPKDYSFFSSTDYEDYFRRFNLALIPIFRLINLNFADNHDFVSKSKNLENNLIVTKKKLLSKILKNILQKKEISQEEKNDIIQQWKSEDMRLLDLIWESLSLFKDKKYTFQHIEISEYYNNRAFESEISGISTADLTGEGTHFLMENIPCNSIWRQRTFEFLYFYPKRHNDNISCAGQKIKIDCKEDFSSIALLGCSEYGSYVEQMIIEYTNGEVRSLDIEFSDFFQAPIFKEVVYWNGRALDRKNNKTTVHNFNARLLAKRYGIFAGKIASITLPNRRNIHIFAITLEN